MSREMEAFLDRIGARFGVKSGDAFGLCEAIESQFDRMAMLEADLAFLIPRSLLAGVWRSSEERDTGTSSNSIVAIAYGVHGLDAQILPGDRADLEACELMWAKLPIHRKTCMAIAAMERAREAVR